MLKLGSGRDEKFILCRACFKPARYWHVLACHYIIFVSFIFSKKV